MKLDLVIDANVLFRTLISHGFIVNLMFHNDLTIFAPEKLKEEFNSNKNEILRKSNLTEEEFNEFVNLIFKQINFVSLTEYQKHLAKAKELLGNHKKDAEFIALCLAKNVKLWTYEKLLFDIGFGISTKEIDLTLYR